MKAGEYKINPRNYSTEAGLLVSASELIHVIRESADEILPSIIRILMV